MLPAAATLYDAHARRLPCDSDIFHWPDGALMLPRHERRAADAAAFSMRL